MSRIIVLMVAVMVTAANALAQNTTGQVEEKQDSATLSVNDTIALKDVEVVTMRQLVKTQDDRVSYNVQADPEASTSTVLDMLRKVPLVSVDGEDNVRVNGSSSFNLRFSIWAKSYVVATRSLFYVCGIFTVRAENKCVVSNFTFYHEFF